MECLRVYCIYVHQISTVFFILSKLGFIVEISSCLKKKFWITSFLKLFSTLCNLFFLKHLPITYVWQEQFLWIRKNQICFVFWVIHKRLWLNLDIDSYSIVPICTNNFFVIVKWNEVKLEIRSKKYWAKLSESNRYNDTRASWCSFSNGEKKNCLRTYYKGPKILGFEKYTFMIVYNIHICFVAVEN